MTLIQSTRFFVPKMTCASCKRRIHQALHDLDGVEQLEILIEQREVVVKHDVLAISRDDLSDALEAAHYPGERVPA